MEVTVLATQLHSSTGFTFVEGSVRVSVPLLMHAQSRINREELKPLSLEAVLVGKSGDAFFYSSEPVVLWRSSLMSASDPALQLLNQGRENVWSFVSDVSTGTSDHSQDDDFNENDRIFDTALRQGASFMQFPFRFKISNTLPPSMAPAKPHADHAPDSACPFCAAQLKQLYETDLVKPGLVKFPQYEVMAMLSFESFAVSAYQVVSAPIQLSRGLPSEIVDDEVLKGEGVVAAGAFRYKIWDAAKYYVLDSNQPYEFKLQLVSGTVDLTKIESITIRPVYRFKHINSPDLPSVQHSHLYTPYQNSHTQPSRTITLPQGLNSLPSQTFQISLPALKIPYPTATNLGYWMLENSLEISILYHSPQSAGVGSLGRIMKPSTTTHVHHLHHEDAGFVQLTDGSRLGFVNIPIVAVQPWVDSIPAVVPRVTGDEAADKREEMEVLMDRVDKHGDCVGGTVSCLFSAKKLVRIGLKDWVSAGTDEEMSVVPGAGGSSGESQGAVAMYRSDAKVPKAESVSSMVVNVPPPSEDPVAVAASTSPTSPVIPVRTVSAISIRAELDGPANAGPVSPAIPQRMDSTDVLTIIKQDKEKQRNRQSIVQSLKLTELTAQSNPIVIPKRTNSQPRRIFVQQQQQQHHQSKSPKPLPLSRGMGPGAGIGGVPRTLAAGRPNAPLPPLPGQQPPPNLRLPARRDSITRRDMIANATGSHSTSSDPSNNGQWGSGIPGSSVNRVGQQPKSGAATQQLASVETNPIDDDDTPVSSLSYEQDLFFADPTPSEPTETNPPPLGPQTDGEDDDTESPLRKQVTFNEHIQKFSAKSYTLTESSNSETSTILSPSRQNRMSSLSPFPPTSPTIGMSAEAANAFAQQMDAESAYSRRISLGTQLENEILGLGTSVDEQFGVQVDDAVQLSMVPGGREVIEGVSPSPWVGGEAGGVAEDEFGRPLRSASLPRRGGARSNVVTGVGANQFSSMPRGASAGGGAGSGRPTMEQYRQEYGKGAGGTTEDSTWVKSGAFLTRMVGSMGRAVIPQSIGRSASQERGAGSLNTSPVGTPLASSGSALSAAPSMSQKSPVVITPRTSSARWTEDK
ncbi:hypothetical protein HDU98_009519 [Podochytrium sp. JEL0797]|nr:hypothetical protein HDU98_009519 [Podochytrium sp. JEL0797]